VQTEPGSALLLDGKPVGHADSDGRLMVPAVVIGNHKLSARAEGYLESIVQVSLAGNEEKHVTLPLEWLGGFLSVAATPDDAKISVIGPKTLEALFVRGPSQLLLGLNWDQPPEFFVIGIASLATACQLILAARFRPSLKSRTLILFGMGCSFDYSGSFSVADRLRADKFAHSLYGERWRRRCAGATDRCNSGAPPPSDVRTRSFVAL